jgi:hypothetical protein
MLYNSDYIVLYRQMTKLTVGVYSDCSEGLHFTIQR